MYGCYLRILPSSEVYTRDGRHGIEHYQQHCCENPIHWHSMAEQTQECCWILRQNPCNSSSNRKHHRREHIPPEAKSMSLVAWSKNTPARIVTKPHTSVTTALASWCWKSYKLPCKRGLRVRGIENQQFTIQIKLLWLNWGSNLAKRTALVNMSTPHCRIWLTKLIWVVTIIDVGANITSSEAGDCILAHSRARIDFAQTIFYIRRSCQRTKLKHRQISTSTVSHKHPNLACESPILTYRPDLLKVSYSRMGDTTKI